MYWCSFATTSLYVPGDKLRALRERVEILAHRELLDLRQQRVERRLRPGQRVMVPRGCGLGRKVERKGPIAAADRRRREIDVPVEREVEHRREQHDAVDADALPLQALTSIAERGVPYDSPKRNFGEFQRPNVADVARDELREGAHVGIDAEEIARLAGADDPAEAGIGRVDEHEIGAIEQRVLVIDQIERRVAASARHRRPDTRIGPKEPIRSQIVELPGPPL